MSGAVTNWPLVDRSNNIYRDSEKSHPQICDSIVKFREGSSLHRLKTSFQITTNGEHSDITEWMPSNL